MIDKPIDPIGKLINLSVAAEASRIYEQLVENDIRETGEEKRKINWRRLASTITRDVLTGEFKKLIGIHGVDYGGLIKEISDYKVDLGHEVVNIWEFPDSENRSPTIYKVIEKKTDSNGLVMWVTKCNNDVKHTFYDGEVISLESFNNIKVLINYIVDEYVEREIELRKSYVLETLNKRRKTLVGVFNRLLSILKPDLHNTFAKKVNRLIENPSQQYFDDILSALLLEISSSPVSMRQHKPHMEIYGYAATDKDLRNVSGLGDYKDSALVHNYPGLSILGSKVVVLSSEETLDLDRDVNATIRNKRERLSRYLKLLVLKSRKLN